jgi:hypothetical protein
MSALVRAAADDDAADGDGVTAGDGVAAGGGSAEVHCTTTTPAASISASTAPRRLKDVNWDESSNQLVPLLFGASRALRCHKESASETTNQA